MALSKDLQNHLAQTNLAAIEDAWMARIESDPTDLDFFIEVAQAVTKTAGDASTAGLLLEMLDEHLENANRADLRLEVLRNVGELLEDDASELHGMILDCLEGVYGDRPSFEALVEKVGLKKAIDDTPKNWKKVERLEALLSYDIGSIVHMEGKGAGNVVEVNMALESFKINFERIGDVRVGFAAAPKLLKSLTADHILRLKHEDKERIDRLRKEDPPELLRLVLESYDGPRTGAEVRADLVGTVPKKSWSSWWAAARKHPQVLAIGSGRRSYAWAASTADADDAVWDAFKAADVRGQIEHLRRHGGREADLTDRMVVSLAKTARAATASDPGLAAAIWLGLEKHSGPGGQATAALEALVDETTDLRVLSKGIADRAARERLYELTRERRETWIDDFAALVETEPEARALDILAEGLESGDQLGRTIDDLLNQPRRAPGAFVWLVERASTQEAYRQRNPVRLIEQVLWALADRPTFGTYRVRLAPSVESGGVVPRSIGDLDEDQALRAERAIAKAGGIEDYQREPLISAIHMKFPGLRHDEEAPLYATTDAIAQKRAELKTLLEQEIPTNRKAIEEARELGDLRENFEYKSARQRHEYLAARAAALDNDLRRVRPIDTSTVSGEEVVIGAVLHFGNGSDRTLTILGPWNSDPDQDILSNESELAQSLLGSKVGDDVEIGDETLTIERITPWPGVASG